MKIHQPKRDALLDKTLTVKTQHESLELISAITLDTEFLEINLSQLGRIKGANLRAIVTKIISGFRKLKWPSACRIDKDEYLSKISSGKWSELPTKEKHLHTMSNCVQC